MIKFSYHSKHLAVSLEIYADLESVSGRFNMAEKNSNTSYTEKYQEHISWSFSCINDEFRKPVVLCRRKNANDL